MTVLASAQKRFDELDRMFNRIYEDNVNGKLSDERFAKMSASYEAEQAELADTIKNISKCVNDDILFQFSYRPLQAALHICPHLHKQTLRESSSDGQFPLSFRRRNGA